MGKEIALMRSNWAFRFFSLGISYLIFHQKQAFLF